MGIVYYTSPQFSYSTLLFFQTKWRWIIDLFWWKLLHHVYERRSGQVSADHLILELCWFSFSIFNRQSKLDNNIFNNIDNNIYSGNQHHKKCFSDGSCKTLKYKVYNSI
jgi:hypothetical protein